MLRLSLSDNKRVPDKSISLESSQQTQFAYGFCFWFSKNQWKCHL